MKKFSIDLDKLASLTGRVNAYWFDTNHILLGYNRTMLEMFRKHNVTNKQELIGCSFMDLFGDENQHLAHFAIQENEEVMRKNTSIQYTNTLILPDSYKIKLLTVKAPYYTNDGKTAGVFGISHHISEFSLAGIRDLKFSNRETECLMYFLKGKTMREISEILGISLKTVGTYIDRLKAKLNCSTKSQLISKAIEIGLQEELLS